MKTIWKYTLTLVGAQQTLLMPMGATIQSVAIQGGLPTLWAEVDASGGSPDTQEPRHFYVYGTGHPIPNGVIYVGSAVGVPYVWHIYEYVT